MTTNLSDAETNDVLRGGTAVTEAIAKRMSADAYLALGDDLNESAKSYARDRGVTVKAARAFLVQHGTSYAGFRSFWAGSVSESVRLSMEAAS